MTSAYEMALNHNYKYMHLSLHYVSLIIYFVVMKMYPIQSNEYRPYLFLVYFHEL